MASVKLSNPVITLISNVTGQAIVVDEIINQEYWVTHTRNAVRFDDGIRALIDDGYNNFIEIGPQPVLLGMAQEGVRNSTINMQFLPSILKIKDNGSKY